MIGCTQKYCANCIKPVFDKNNKFLFGHCKASTRGFVLRADAEDSKNNDIQPLYCYYYKPRKRKLHY